MTKHSNCPICFGTGVQPVTGIPCNCSTEISPTDKIVRFEPKLVGENYRIDTDQILTAAIGKKFERLVIIGTLQDDEIYLAGSANAGESLILLHMAINEIVSND